jgi:hypothetical protein
MGFQAFHQPQLYREPVAAKVRPEPGESRPAPDLRQSDLRVDFAGDPGGGVAEAFTAVFAPSARATQDILSRQFFLAPLSGPARFAASPGIPFALEICLPRPPTLVSEPYPGKMKIFVQQYPAMLPWTGFQRVVENNQAASDVCSGVGGIARCVAKIPAVPDFDLVSVKKLRDGPSGRFGRFRCRSLRVTFRYNQSNCEQ